MSPAAPVSAMAALTRFYEAESAYLHAGDGDVTAIAATLDPECVIYQPASLPTAASGAGMRASRPG